MSCKNWLETIALLCIYSGNDCFVASSLNNKNRSNKIVLAILQ